MLNRALTGKTLPCTLARASRRTRRRGGFMVRVNFSRLRFLIIDDNAHMRRIMRTLLHGYGTREVYEAEDGAGGLEAGITGLRIAYSPTLGYAKVAPEVAALTEKAVAALASLGAIVEPADPGFASPRDVFWSLWSASCATAAIRCWACAR